MNAYSTHGPYLRGEEVARKEPHLKDNLRLYFRFSICLVIFINHFRRPTDKEIEYHHKKMSESNISQEENEILQLTQEALKLATAAVHFGIYMQCLSIFARLRIILTDSCVPPNLVGACDYYDKCLLTIDEALNKLSHNSNEWKNLLEIRLQYDDRMELLRERYFVVMYSYSLVFSTIHRVNNY